IGHIKIALGIHGRTLDKGMQSLAALIGLGPVRIGIAQAQMVRHGAPYLRITTLGFLVQKKHAAPLLFFQAGALSSAPPTVDFTCNLLRKLLGAVAYRLRTKFFKRRLYGLIGDRLLHQTIDRVDDFWRRTGTCDQTKPVLHLV